MSDADQMFLYFFHIYIKMSENSLAKYYQENKKKGYKKHRVKDIKRKKSNNMDINNTKISLKMKNKTLAQAQ